MSRSSEFFYLSKIYEQDGQQSSTPIYDYIDKAKEKIGQYYHKGQEWSKEAGRVVRHATNTETPSDKLRLASKRASDHFKNETDPAISKHVNGVVDYVKDKGSKLADTIKEHPKTSLGIAAGTGLVGAGLALRKYLKSRKKR